LRLLNEYGFADKRTRRIENANLFIVDDRSKGDLASNGELYSYFCGIFADVISNEEIKVSIWGNVPHGQKVTEWIELYRPARPHGVWLEFSVQRGEQKMLGELSSATLAIVRRGARYDTPR
jgi:hypothetical protein